MNFGCVENSIAALRKQELPRISDKVCRQNVSVRNIYSGFRQDRRHEKSVRRRAEKFFPNFPLPPPSNAGSGPARSPAF